MVWSSAIEDLVASHVPGFWHWRSPSPRPPPTALIRFSGLPIHRLHSPKVQPSLVLKTFHAYGDVELASGRSDFLLDVPTGAAIKVDDQSTGGLIVFQAFCFGPHMPRALRGGTPEQVRVAWNDSKAGVWRMGPVVMVLNALSDTHLATASSGQSTWIYAPITPSGPLAIRLSECHRAGSTADSDAIHRPTDRLCDRQWLLALWRRSGTRDNKGHGDPRGVIICHRHRTIRTTTRRPTSVRQRPALNECNGSVGLRSLVGYSFWHPHSK